jgi:hypothetical protein
MKMEKKHQESKNASEDDAVSEDANADGNATIEKQKHNSNSEDSNGNENLKKNYGSKNKSEDYTASKKDKSNAVQGELKDHDKFYFISPSEELNAYIATTNKNNSTCDKQTNSKINRNYPNARSAL